MAFQSLKYLLVRIGISFFLLVVPGFFALYLLHEYALPGVEFDDDIVQWALVFISIFFGFFAYGLIGDQHFQNAFHALRDIDSSSDPETTIARFEELLGLTRSSYFLPRAGERLRGLVVRKYADYLLSTGREGPEALKIYLKAFLQSPRQSKFRPPLLSLLAQGGDLGDEEIDLLLVMLKAENYQDELVLHYLAGLFLRRKKLSGKTEPLFLIALESGHEQSPDIAGFVLPQLLAHQRRDQFAIRFYLASLPFQPTGEERARELIAKSFLEGHWSGIEHKLHERCGQVFFALDPERRAALEEAVRLSRVSGKLKKVKWLSTDDRRQLRRVMERLGIVRSLSGELWRGVRAVAGWLAGFFKRLLLKAIDGLALFGRASLGFKLTFLALLSAGVVVALSSRGVQEPPPEPVVQAPPPAAIPVAKPGNKIHTLQVAAFTSPRQADRLVRSLGKHGVEDAYIVKSKRASGGQWFKIRIGRFDDPNEAKQLANRLVDSKVIKNYFVISLPRTQPGPAAAPKAPKL
jgi:hypothetical protein